MEKSHLKFGYRALLQLMEGDIHCQFRARRVFTTLNDVLLRTRRVLSP